MGNQICAILYPSRIGIGVKTETNKTKTKPSKTVELTAIPKRFPKCERLIHDGSWIEALRQRPALSPLESFSNLNGVHFYSIYFLFGVTALCSVAQTLRRVD